MSSSTSEMLRGLETGLRRERMRPSPPCRHPTPPRVVRHIPTPEESHGLIVRNSSTFTTKIASFALDGRDGSCHQNASGSPSGERLPADRNAPRTSPRRHGRRHRTDAPATGGPEARSRNQRGRDRTSGWGPSTFTLPSSITSATLRCPTTVGTDPSDAVRMKIRSTPPGSPTTRHAISRPSGRRANRTDGISNDVGASWPSSSEYDRHT
jgi:hypothetical protein